MQIFWEPEVMLKNSQRILSYFIQSYILDQQAFWVNFLFKLFAWTTWWVKK